MSSSWNVPAELEHIVARPGLEWTDTDRVQIIVWLTQPTQQAFLLRLVTVCMGGFKVVSPVDAEDALWSFMFNDIDRVIRYYSPEKGSFVALLTTALKRATRRKGTVLRGRRERLSAAMLGRPPAVVVPQGGDDPEQALWRRDVTQRVQACVSALPADDRELITHYYFDDQALKTIAGSLGISEGAVKVRIHRARRKLADCVRDASL